MILVDTSVMVGYLRGLDGQLYDKLSKFSEKGVPFGINVYIYQELLQGAKDVSEYSLLKEYLGSLIFYDLMHGITSFEHAAMNYHRCRKKGITVRSTIDMLIAQTAIDNDLYLMHNDSDFANMASVIKELKLF